MNARGLIFAAPASGSGKTTLVAGLLRLLTRRGLRISAAKLGPDYIDPAFHAAATGTACLNIDLWAMRPETISALLDRLLHGKELAIVEAAMGLFDGAADGHGSAADFAAFCGWPVILVIDAHGQAQSVAALLSGFAHHRADVQIVGVIFNRVGSASHEASLRHAVEPLEIPVLGAIPRKSDLVLPERHLGLVQAMEHADLEDFLDLLAGQVMEGLSVERLLDLARPARFEPVTCSQALLPPLGQRTAVARDAAFAFLYAGQLECWREAGVELEFFSPLGDQQPSDDCDAVYLPGGYPELHAGQLAANEAFMTGLRWAAARGAAVFGECGGYMILGAGLIDEDGRRHAMANLLPLESSFAEPRLHLGYRQARVLSDCPLGAQGVVFRGHEFHYASVVEEGPGEALFECSDALGRALGRVGRRRGTVAGSFMHLIDRQTESPSATSAALDITP